MAKDFQKLKKLFINDPEMLRSLEQQEQAELLRELASKKVNMEGVEMIQIKGDKGDEPTDERLLSLIEPLIPEPKHGEDGYTPIKGVDYFDGKDADETKIVKDTVKEISKLIPTKAELLAGIKIPVPEKIDTEKLKADILKRIPKVEKTPTIEELVKEIKEKKLLELRDIRGARLDMGDQRWHGGGISNITGLITAGTNVTITGTGISTDPYVINAAGSVPPVTSVFGRVGAIVATSGDYTTAQVTESGNLYYTQARFDTAFAAKSTTNLAEGTNLYFTNARSIASTLTGYTSGAGTITSADSILSAIQKLNGNIGALTTGVSSVSGTANRITSTGGATPVIDISASYVGQSSITTLGTITTGVWNGTSIANANLANSTISGVSLGGTLGALTATNSTLTFSGSYTGGTARTVGINLATANTWTGSITTGSGATIGANTPAVSGVNLTLGAGSTTTVPLRFNSGALRTSGNVAGDTEFLTDKAYLTITTSTKRVEIGLIDTAMTSGQMVFATTNGRMISNAISGDLTMSSSGVGTIAGGAVSYAKMQNFGAYKMIANNTNSSAVATEQTYRSQDSQNIVSTITFTGAVSPSGGGSQSYTWQQVGKVVTVQFSLTYSIAGTAITGVTIALPSDMPVPVYPGGLTGANDIIYTGDFYMATSVTGLAAMTTNGVVTVDGTGTSANFNGIGSAINANTFLLTFSYRTP